MRAWEFIGEAGPTNDGNPPKLATPVTAAPKPITSTGTQPKPLNVTASKNSPSTAPSAPTLGSPTANNATQSSDSQQNAQQKQQHAQQQTQMTKNLQGLAQKIGMDNQQTQMFTQKLMGTGSQAGGAGIKQISPADMQKAMPKPGSNLNIKGIGQSKVLPTPSDEKGVKVDTTNKLGYPILIDPRDLQQ